jgi:hypothetical protein
MLKKLLLTAFLAVGLFASTLTTGSEIPTLKIKDQFEKEHTLDGSIKQLFLVLQKMKLLLLEMLSMLKVKLNS